MANSQYSIIAMLLHMKHKNKIPYLTPRHASLTFMLMATTEITI